MKRSYLCVITAIILSYYDCINCVEVNLIVVQTIQYKYIVLKVVFIKLILSFGDCKSLIYFNMALKFNVSPTELFSQITSPHYQQLHVVQPVQLYLKLK